jgi:hypothetical protein
MGRSTSRALAALSSSRCPPHTQAGSCLVWGSARGWPDRLAEHGLCPAEETRPPQAGMAHRRLWAAACPDLRLHGSEGGTGLTGGGRRRSVSNDQSSCSRQWGSTQACLRLLDAREVCQLSQLMAAVSVNPAAHADGRPIWQAGRGAPYVLAPHLHIAGDTDPLLPLRHTAWQPLRDCSMEGTRKLSEAAGLPDHRRATAHAQALLALAQKATAHRPRRPYRTAWCPLGFPRSSARWELRDATVQATVVNLIGV